jgi:radical SAM protein with 4Fe4S-binding SPASM domain
VISTLSELLDLDLPVAIESVYTSLHVREKFSVVDLLQFCYELGIKKLIFDIAYPPAPAELVPLNDPYFEPLLLYHREAVDWWFKALLGNQDRVLQVYFRDLLLPMMEGKPAVAAAGGCTAGERDFAIGPDGDVFACQLFYGDPAFRLGNVLSGQYPGISSSFPLGPKDVSDCTDCFARYWCQPCAALNRSCGNLWHPPERLCTLRKTVVLQIARWALEYLPIPENTITSALRDAVVQHVEPLASTKPACPVIP